MRKTVLIALCLAAGLVVVGPSVTPAMAAHEWERNGVPITQELEVLTEGSLHEFSFGGKFIHCESILDVGDILPGGKDLLLRALYHGCTTSAANCLVNTAGQPKGLILLVNIKTKLILTKTAGGTTVVADEFEEPASKEFVTLLFEADVANACSSYGSSMKVKGHVAAQVINTAGDELLEFPNPELEGNTLETFGVNASLFGKDKQKLEIGGSLLAS